MIWRRTSQPGGRQGYGSIGLTAWALVAAAVFSLLLLGFASSPPPQAPAQPIAYSHRLHAGELEISCQYCHVYARRSAVAGVPSVKKCMGCHDFVAYEAEEVQKIVGYWERDEPIPWERIYDLPDHTVFFHDRHVKQGIDCAECHGPVETMEQVTLFRSLEMGWCVDCHRESEASLDCLACHY